jgi:hypothetical protein
MTTENLDAYRKNFGLGDDDRSNVAEKALEIALDIRKFEISLYWQRAAYFWTFIAFAFGGYFAILSTDLDALPDKRFIAFMIACVGLVFNWAWCLVNKGSKYWQENWENHVYMLEDDVVGPLFKTRLERPPGAPFVERIVTGPASFSVSKINQWVSCFTFCIWIALIVANLSEMNITNSELIKHGVVGALTLFFGFMMFAYGKTFDGHHEHHRKKRETTIVDPTESEVAKKAKS